MQEILITGAGGFIGRAICKIFNENDVPFIGFSRSKQAGYEYVASYLDLPKSKTIIHLAEESSRPLVNKMGHPYIKNSLEITRSLASKSEKLIYLSSSAVYGDCGASPYKTDAIVSTGDAYSQNKLLNEKVVQESGGIILRASNLFGPGMYRENVLSDILRQRSTAGPLIVRDDSSICDFLHVDSAADLISRLPHIKISGVMNLGSGVGISIGELAQIAINSWGAGCREVISLSKKKSHSYNVVDISETQKIFSWNYYSQPINSLHSFFENYGK